jgi:hypothetical protein
MSDQLRDAMSRAVDRIAPFPPNAEALKAAAKRSRYRRHIIGGWIGFIILSTLSGWLFFDNESYEGRPRPDRNQIAAPVTWENPSVTGRVQLPTSAMELVGTENELWAAMDGGTLLRINSQTRGITGTFEVGLGVEKIATDDGQLWVGHVDDKSFENTPIIPGAAYNALSEFDPVTNKSRELADFEFTRGPIVAESGNVFLFAKIGGSKSGGLKMHSRDGQIRELGFSTGDLAAADGSVWTFFNNSEMAELDASTGEIVRWVGSDSSNDGEAITCYVCPSPDKGAIAASDNFVVRLMGHEKRLDVFDRGGRFLHSVRNLDHSGKVVIEGSHAFVGLNGRRLAVVDLESGEVSAELETGVEAGPMAVSNGSVWIADLEGEEIVEVSNLGPKPAPVASAELVTPVEDPTPVPVESGEPSPSIEGPGDGRCCNFSYRDEELGFSVAYPDDWTRATEPMTKLVNPREILTLSTIPLDVDEGQLGDCAPVEPLSRLGPMDVLIHVQERQFAEPGPDSKDYPERPAELGMDDLDGPEALECWGNGIHRTTFSDSGRAILVYVALGEKVTPDWYDAPSEVLDSLHFEPVPNDGE